MANDVEIKFNHKVVIGFYGANGFGNMTGLTVREWKRPDGDAVTLWPITGKGEMSHSCKLTIPVEHLAEFINVLSQFLPLTNGEDEVK